MSSGTIFISTCQEESPITATDKTYMGLHFEKVPSNSASRRTELIPHDLLVTLVLGYYF